MKNILELTYIEARKFFLKEKSHFNFDLPTYFTFQKLLNKLSLKFEDVDYKFLNNKDGKFAWRTFLLINSALYVSLVHCFSSPNHPTQL